jgi:hypothetical protein
LEGQPAFEAVFGDVDRYRSYIDRGLAVSMKMQGLRDEFSRSIQWILAALPQGEKRVAGRACPTEKLIAPYQRAFRLGQTYLASGHELQRYHDAVREFDRLGETAGLTPDYKWKVKRILTAYPETLTDYRDMRVAFRDQLDSELRFLGCDPQALMTYDAATAKTALAAAEKSPAGGGVGAGAPGAPKTGSTAGANNAAPRITASNVTFFVDNLSCPSPLRLVLDTAAAGTVSARTKTAFQASAGPHDLCLLPGSSKQRCGDAGTVRKAYIHDGWTITMRCN